MSFSTSSRAVLSRQMTWCGHKMKISLWQRMIIYIVNLIGSEKSAVRYRNKAIFLLKSVSRFGYDYYGLKDHARLLEIAPLKSTEFREKEVRTLISLNSSLNM